MEWEIIRYGNADVAVASMTDGYEVMVEHPASDETYIFRVWGPWREKDEKEFVSRQDAQYQEFRGIFYRTKVREAQVRDEVGHHKFSTLSEGWEWAQSCRDEHQRQVAATAAKNDLLIEQLVRQIG